MIDVAFGIAFRDFGEQRRAIGFQTFQSFTLLEVHLAAIARGRRERPGIQSELMANSPATSAYRSK